MRGIWTALIVTACSLFAGAAWAGSSEWFDDGIKADSNGDAAAAFTLFKKAADEGLPEAQFNVAVMLDSGRGVEGNEALAALWYARAASRGNARAAYNLGQLYEAGAGVPRNLALANAWFAESRLPAGREHRLSVDVKRSNVSAALRPPNLLFPKNDARLAGSPAGIEMVWTCEESSNPTSFYLEVKWADVTGSNTNLLFSGFHTVSSLLLKPPTGAGTVKRRAERGVRRYVCGERLASVHLD